jgi:hypothetical protein
MTDQNLSHIYFLLDRSGSMTSIRTETIAGFDAFIAEQRKVPSACKVTLSQGCGHRWLPAVHRATTSGGDEGSWTIARSN